MNQRIVPLNRPARAGSLAAGNPANARLESAVGVCFPGLEADHRNLDRRFFPGLVFDFVFGDDPDPNANQLGAQLIALDLNDPDLPKTDEAFKTALGEIQNALTKTALFLDSLQQASPGGPDALAISLWNRSDQHPRPFTGQVVWRLVRSLVPGPVTITVSERGGDEPGSWTLTGTRRDYVQKDGTLSEAYPPGELTESLCSPWQHDFRDCGCFYWASNHPDIVLGPDPEGMNLPGGAGSGDFLSDIPRLWMRYDQMAAPPPAPIKADNRPFEMDHYEINQRWQDLSFVLENHEVRTIYAPKPAEMAEPFGSLGELVERLQWLALIELTLALEYLYARYSIILDGPASPQRDHAEFLAHELLVIATSEMMHLRWVNQLLWELWHRGYANEYEPVLGVTGKVPTIQGQSRDADLRRLDAAVDDFVKAEQPSATLEGQYARVFATLAAGYPHDLAELVSRIIADGVSHFERFQEISSILRFYADPPAGPNQPPRASRLVRELTEVELADPRIQPLTEDYRTIVTHLRLGYLRGNVEDRADIPAAREAMGNADRKALNLAAAGIGAPLFDIIKEVTKAP